MKKLSLLLICFAFIFTTQANAKEIKLKAIVSELTCKSLGCHKFPESIKEYANTYELSFDLNKTNNYSDSVEILQNRVGYETGVLIIVKKHSLTGNIDIEARSKTIAADNRIHSSFLGKATFGQSSLSQFGTLEYPRRASSDAGAKNMHYTKLKLVLNQ